MDEQKQNANVTTSEAVTPEVCSVLDNANVYYTARERELMEELEEANAFQRKINASERDLKMVADLARKLKRRSQLNVYVRNVMSVMKEGDRDLLERAMKDFDITAIATIGRLIQSDDDNVALKASIFIVEMCHGKATQRTEITEKNDAPENIQKALANFTEEDIRKIAGLTGA
jgi:hypothetical protein